MARLDAQPRRRGLLLGGRYIERAENVARILDVNHQGIIENSGPEAEPSWWSVVATVSERYIRVAYGRDYADVTPIEGSYRGTGASSLDVAVTVGVGRQQQQQQ